MSDSNSGFNLDFVTVGTPIAFLFLFVILSLFQFRTTIPYFQLVLWLGVPILAFIIVFVTNLINQQISCKTTNANKALSGSVPSLVMMWVGLGIASISYCRIPVASVFTPLIVGETVDIVANNGTSNTNSVKTANSKRCCSSTMTLEKIESNYPIIAGLGYGFYVMFSILFGFVFGNGFAMIC